MSDIGEFLAMLPEETKGPTQTGAVGSGGYVEWLMQKGEFGQLNEEEKHYLAANSGFKEEVFEPIATPQGTTYRLKPMEKK